MTSRFLLGLAAALLLLVPGCKEPGTESTAGTALYAYDSSTSSVFVWTDLSTLYSGGTATVAPTKTITSSVFSSMISSMAWGGLCLDSQNGYLYLVSDSGNIVRVGNIRSQNGVATSSDVVSFSLSTTGRLSSSTFGQASLDAQTNTLYITENSSSGTQIWVVGSASSQVQNATITLQSLQSSGDSGGTGVASASGVVYAFMLNGDTIGTVETYSGPRLRKGTASGFTDSNTIIGSSTLLGQYGSLALDTGNGYLFVGRHNTDAGATTAPIQAFTTGLFGQTYNEAPTLTLGSASGQPNLRVIAHAGTKSWLVGLAGDGTTTTTPTAYGTIWIWQSPLGGTAAITLTASPTTSLFKAVALDGNAS